MQSAKDANSQVLNAFSPVVKVSEETLAKAIGVRSSVCEKVGRLCGTEPAKPEQTTVPKCADNGEIEALLTRLGQIQANLDDIYTQVARL